MVRNRQPLHESGDLAVDNGEREAEQPNLPDVRWASDLESVWRLDCQADSVQHGSVIPQAQTRAASFVVGELLFMLQRRFWVEPITHFSRA